MFLPNFTLNLKVLKLLAAQKNRNYYAFLMAQKYEEV